MTAITLDGVATASAVKSELTSRIRLLKAHGVVPGLGTLLVGDDPASRSYVAGKHRDCAEVGIEGELHSPLPCTPAGIVEMLRRYDVPIRGQHVTVIGRGLTVGRPLGLLFTRKGLDATVTLTHSRTQDLAAEVRRADIVVAAVGVPHLVQPDWVKPGAAVLDVGITRVQDEESGKGTLTGDVDPGVAEVAGYLSPNPGGVGPMTRAMLLANVVKSAEQKLHR